MISNLKQKTFSQALAIVVLTLLCSAKVSVGSTLYIQKIKDSNEKLVPEIFDLFLKKFNDDPNFQLSRVKFPFKITEYPDEGEKPTHPRFLSKKDWKRINLVQHGEIIIRKEITSKTSVTVQLMLEDTGVVVNHYFKCIKGEWWLVQLEDASD